MEWGDVSDLLRPVSLLDYGQVAQLLDVSPLLVLSTNNNRTSALHIAASIGDVDMVELLVTRGADVNGRNIDGSTPLCEACGSGNIDVAEFLVSRGAFVNVPLLTFSPLHEAAIKGNADCCQLLISRGAKLNGSDGHHGTPLHTACYYGHFGAVRVLLCAGADVNARMIHITPLHYAVKAESFEIVQLLVAFGADIWATDNRDKRPDHFLPKDHPIRQWLMDQLGAVRSLQQCCRLIIRSRCAANNLDRLELPIILLSFVKFQ